nr:MAG TPA: AAA domain protein [Bacteriophage sp.]
MEIQTNTMELCDQSRSTESFQWALGDITGAGSGGSGGKRDTESLRGALRELQADGIPFSEISKATEVHRTAISQLVNQGVTPSHKHMAALWAFVDAQRAAALPVETEPVEYRQELYIWEHEEYMTALGWCGYIYNKRKMGVLIGAPGTGKTTILKQMAIQHPGCIYVEAMSSMRVRDLVSIIAREAGITVKGNVYSRMQDLIAGLKSRKDVAILIDEAEYLKKWDVDKFEYLRKIWDNTGTPVILAGTPELETILTRGAGKDNLAQLYRRKYELQLKGISEKVALTHLRHYHLTTDAAKMLAQIGADTGHGGLGNLTEVLELCLEAADGGEINAGMVKEATRYKLMFN